MSNDKSTGASFSRIRTRTLDMNYRFSLRFLLLARRIRFNHQHQQRLCFTSLLRKAQATQARASINGNGGGSSSSEGQSFLVPGATVATIFMLGVLHARRLYNDKKIEEARERGIDFELQPDVKDIPIWMRPYAYRAWARAFHSNLEEAAMPLDHYPSLRDFFIRTLKEGSRPIDFDPCCLISPVDGIVLRYGELKEAGAMIEQVKGFSYSISSLLGANSFLPLMASEDKHGERSGLGDSIKDESRKSWWRISLASPKVREPSPSCPVKGLFYCVIYLKPGDYHRIHSPADWNVVVRRHFPGRLFPLNERATRTIKNLYIENERVVLEGQWQEGYMAMAAIGATNIGSIELFIEPELKTNRPRKKLFDSEPPEEQVYEPKGTGVTLKKGDEIGAFNLGSTVVLVFQAPVQKEYKEKAVPSEFRFSVGRGDRIRMGEALGRWQDS